MNLDNDLYEASVVNQRSLMHNVVKNYEEWLDILGVELGGHHEKINETQRKIIHLLDDFGIDRISIAGIMETLEQSKLDEEEFLRFLQNRDELTIEDCTDKLWDMRGYY